MKIRIAGTGMYSPPKVETAADLAPRIGRSEEWILSRTGVRRRHVAEVSMEVMAAHAAREALGDGGKPDLIINASTTPLQLIPDSSVFIQEELGLSGIPSFSVHATCLSFLVALRNASFWVESGAARRVLVVSSEVSSGNRNFDEPESAALFGDGAGAAVVVPAEPGADSGFLAWEMATFPKGAHLTELRGAGTRYHPLAEHTRPEDNLFHMDGPGVYKMARRRAAVVLRRVFRQAEMTPEDLDVVIPHQASGPMMEALPKYDLPAEKTVNIVAEYGNCVAASLAMALHVANREGRLGTGTTALFAGTGAGLSVAAAIFRF